jgi:hypothetical protein
MNGNLGWGGAPWGGGGWGGAGAGPLQVSAVLAVAENILRLTLTRQVYFSTLLDPLDASDPTHYAVAIVAGTSGLDGTPVRPVVVVHVDPSPTFALIGTQLDLTLDRPMTAFPAQYVLTVSNLIAADLVTTLDPPPFNAAQTFAVFKLIAQPRIDQPTPSRDFGNPQLRSAMLDPLPNPGNALNLGVYTVDDSGDYAFDEGLTGYKKRILRRLITMPGGFAHLPAYGVGITSHGKQLVRASVLEGLAQEAQKQIFLEPETSSASVHAAMDPSVPGLVRFQVRAQTKTGQSLRFSARVPTP